MVRKQVSKKKRKKKKKEQISDRTLTIFQIALILGWPNRIGS